MNQNKPESTYYLEAMVSSVRLEKKDNQHVLASVMLSGCSTYTFQKEGTNYNLMMKCDLSPKEPETDDKTDKSRLLELIAIDRSIEYKETNQRLTETLISLNINSQKAGFCVEMEIDNKGTCNNNKIISLTLGKDLCS